VSSPPTHERTFPRHGWAGLALLALGQTLTLVHLRPLSDYWYGICWYGFLLAGDAWVLRRQGRSLLACARRDLFLMIGVSAAGWWGFELANTALFNNWGYSASPDVPLWAQRLRSTFFFSSLLPATWVAALVALALPWARRPVAIPRWSPSRRALVLLGLAGVAAAIVARLVPALSLPLALVALVLALDPVNHARGRPSLLACAARGDARLPIGLVASSLVAGLVGEGWNYPASPRWTYDVPFIGFAHVFEMPLLGYLGYPMLALALFVLYHFVRGLVPGMPPPATSDDALGLLGS
jgi:hypothetical protein